jgi:L-alanine-DL-glutamate epimerase-like enolase superfamily enzyme
MRITEIETIFVDRFLFVQVHTDEGITGLGESSARGCLEASAGIVPDTPGIGIELAEDAAERWPYCRRAVKTRLKVDGSVMDQ